MKTITMTAALATAIAALAGGAVPAQAQTADEDLRCAAWAMLSSGQVEDEAQKHGTALVMAYFMGRYEARTGNNVSDTLTFEALPALIGDGAETTKQCQPLAAGFGERVTQVGSQINAKAAAARARQDNGDGGR